MKIKFKKTTPVKNHGLSVERHGFSLMELIVVMAMVSIMISVVLYFIAGNKSETELEAAASEVVSVLREAQNYALTGKVVADSSCTGYNFIPTISASSYLVEGESCNLQVNYKLSGNVLFENDPTISFDVPHGTTSGGNITLTKGGNHIYVCVNSAGLIKEEKIQGDCAI